MNWVTFSLNIYWKVTIGPVKQFDLLKIAVTNYLMDEIGFNKMKNLLVEFYSNMIDKGIIMS